MTRTFEYKPVKPSFLGLKNREAQSDGSIWAREIVKEKGETVVLTKRLDTGAIKSSRVRVPKGYYIVNIALKGFSLTAVMTAEELNQEYKPFSKTNHKAGENCLYIRRQGDEEIALPQPQTSAEDQDDTDPVFIKSPVAHKTPLSVVVGA